MPLYFFNVQTGEDLIEDPDGSDLPGLDAARAEAWDSARCLLSERVRHGRPIDHPTFEITDAAGNVLCSVPIRAALNLT